MRDAKPGGVDGCTVWPLSVCAMKKVPRSGRGCQYVCGELLILDPRTSPYLYQHLKCEHSCEDIVEIA